MLPPDLTVSIVNTNNKKLLRECLRSLFETTKKTNLEVFVVDNASTDGSFQMVREQFPMVNLIANTERLGFPANHNQVLRKANGRYTLVLNEDVLILPESIDRMVEFMDNHPEAGAAGCRLLNPDYTWQPSIGVFPTYRSLLCESLYLNKLFPCSYRFSGSNLQLDPEGTVKVDYVIGACLIVRKKVLEQVGLLDEDFFAYMEDTDWCHRIRKAGWEIYFINDAQIIHYYGMSRKNIQDIEMFRRDLLKIKASVSIYFHKYYGWRGIFFQRSLDLMQSMLALFLACVPRKKSSEYIISPTKRAIEGLVLSLRSILTPIPRLLYYTRGKENFKR